MKVTLLGDSIRFGAGERQGYGNRTAELLGEDFQVFQPAGMVVVSVGKENFFYFLRRNFQQLEIVAQCRIRSGVKKQRVAVGFEQQRQAELFLQNI